MLKKLIGVAAGAGLVLTMAGAAFASSTIWNYAEVINEILTAANTGGNAIMGEYVDGGLIETGNAGAATQVTNVVNSNDVDSWDCECDGSYIENWAFVYNGVGTLANTGENVITGGFVGGGAIDSGAAGAASVVTNVVNTNVVNDFWWP